MRFTKSIKIGVIMSILGSMALTTPVMAKPNVPLKDYSTEESDESSYTQVLEYRDLSDEERTDALMDCQLSKSRLKDSFDSCIYDYTAYYYGLKDYQILDLKLVADIAHEGLTIDDDHCFNNGAFITDDYENPKHTKIVCKCSPSDFDKFSEYYNLSEPEWKIYELDSYVSPKYNCTAYNYKDDKCKISIYYYYNSGCLEYSIKYVK